MSHPQTVVGVALIIGLALVPPALAGDAEPMRPPEGAIVLFDGKDTSRWDNAKVSEEGWLSAGAVTKDSFQDCILYLEFNMRPGPEGRKVSGNSGVYLQRRYEIQILNSSGQKPSKGGCGAIYQFKAPDQNATKPLGEWQSYLIAFRAPRWDGGKKTENARITVFHNGAKVHDNVEVPRKTGNGRPEGPEPAPILLQQHGSDVVFRNLWLLPLKPDADPAAKLTALLKQ